MPAVFVHGNPETAAIWGPLFDALEREDVIALSPPGFGAPVPSGWNATMVEYVAWLAAELEAIDGPIDLVGHDWGGGHVIGYLLKHADQVRSWCVDLLGITHRGYVWHDSALTWQTPGAGEAMINEWVAQPKDHLAQLYESVGMTKEAADSVSRAIDADLGRCVLGLYRDAAQPRMANLGAGVGVLEARPGLMINAELDTFVGSDAQAEEMANICGATVVPLKGVGHWWMCEDPQQAAAVLTEFWESVDERSGS